MRINALGLLAIVNALCGPAPAYAQDPVATLSAAANPSDRCSALTGLAVDGGRVTAAVMTGVKPIAAAAGNAAPAAVVSLAGDGRASCRVEILLRPEPDTQIKTEIWLPQDRDWNGKFFGTSTSGIEAIDRRELAGGLARGYATASMEFSGYTFAGPEQIYRFGIDHAALRRNYAWRGVHVMTLAAKAVIERYYARKPAYSLFGGWSGAGYQAIAEATRFPGDYDGLLVGSPSINYANLGFSQGYRYVVTHRSPSSAIPATLLPAIAAQVLAQCDGLDGLADGIIGDPRRCQVDFTRMMCRAPADVGCLSSDQATALAAIYGGLHDPRDGKLIYPGFPAGAELSSGAAVRISGAGNGSFINDATPGPLVWVLGSSFSAEMWSAFDFGEQADRYRAAFAPYENADPDWSAFAARGGKVIFYTGWAESNVNPMDLVNYFQALQAKSGGAEKASRFVRLYLAPGMYHGGTGPGPNLFGQRLALQGTGPQDDAIMALDRWVVEGTPPDALIATKRAGDNPQGQIQRRRSLCPFPQVARWNGLGTIDDAASFDCKTP